MSRPAPRHLKQQPRLAARAVPLVAGRGTAIATGAALSVPASLGGIAIADQATAASGALATTPQAAPRPAVQPKTAPVTVVLRYGSAGSAVKTLQSKLDGLAVDGSFGPRTLAAVRSFQSRQGLPVDGIVGPKTWDALGATRSSGGSPGGSTCAVNVVRYGSGGALVKTVQVRLRISADGSFGPQTLSAVRSFQSSKGLSVDGVVGPATWRALGGFPCGAGGGGGGGGTGTSPGTDTPGSNRPVDPNASYKLPFPSGASHRISQSPSGAFSHDDRYSRYAIDFAMPSGSSVLASRSGTVYKAGWDAFGGGNSVMVRDASGYCMQYNHLSGFSVSRGQTVSQGQRVGSSGSTGNSTGPHLHWGIVTCSGYVSMHVPRTVERGTSYPVGVRATSQNG